MPRQNPETLDHAIARADLAMACLKGTLRLCEALGRLEGRTDQLLREAERRPSARATDARRSPSAELDAERRPRPTERLTRVIRRCCAFFRNLARREGLAARAPSSNSSLS